MRKCFILEDDPARVSWFREKFIGIADLTVIDSCKDVDKFQPPYDAIFLDHDLGGRQMAEHEDCGMTFVNLIKDQLTPPNSNVIIVHSYNEPAGYSMARELFPINVETFYAPFRGNEFNWLIANLFKMWRLIDHENSNNSGRAPESEAVRTTESAD